jgi:hypothetical protein
MLIGMGIIVSGFALFANLDRGLEARQHSPGLMTF